MATPVNDRSVRLLAQSPRTVTAAVGLISMVPALDTNGWTGATIATISDGPVSTLARRSGANTTTLDHFQMIAIEAGRKYRARFWARAVGADGTMSFYLQQFLAYDAGQPAATNGGRSPAQPSAIAPHAAWILYDFVWDVTQWQANAKFFRPDFQLNVGGSVGYWEVQGFTLNDATDTIAAQTAATTAASNAATALGLAQANDTAIAAIVNDNILDRSEKGRIKAEYDAITAEKNPNIAQATSLAVSTTNYASAYSALNAYMAALTPLYTDFTQDTPINGNTFRSYFATYYAERNILLNGISARAAVLAAWTSTSGKPANLAVLTGSEPIQNSLITLGTLGQATYRAIARGNAASASAPGTTGLYVNGALQTTVGAITASQNRSYTVIAITRTTGVIADARTYDVFASAANATAMASYLNSLGNQYVVVVYSFDEPKNNRLTNGLPAAMYRCGASRSVFGSNNFAYQSAYILVGIPGCGEGNGAESYQGAADSDPSAWCDMGFNINTPSGTLTGVSTSFTPKTLADYGYSGDLNATSSITLVGRGVSVQGNNITKVANTYGWDSDCYSRQSYSGGAYVTATIPAICDIFIGLNTDPLYDANFASLDYAWYARGDGLAFFYASGNSLGSVSYTSGDSLTVSYDGDKVRWIKNGVVMWKVSATIALPLYLDTSFLTVNQTLTSVQFGPMANIRTATAALGTPDNIFPDPGFYDLAFWNRLDTGGRFNTVVSDSVLGGFWRTGRRVTMAYNTGGERDTTTDRFPTNKGATYRVTYQFFIDNNWIGEFAMAMENTSVRWETLNVPLPGGSWDALPVMFRSGYAGDPQCPRGTLTYEALVTMNAGDAGNSSSVRVHGYTSADNGGYLEYGSVTIIRVTDAALLAPGAVNNSNLNLSPATINGLTDGLSGAGARTSYATIATYSCSGSGGKAPYSFSFAFEIADQQTPQMRMIPNGSSCSIQAKTINTDGSQSTGVVTCTMTDGNGIATVRSVNVTAT